MTPAGFRRLGPSSALLAWITLALPIAIPAQEPASGILEINYLFNKTEGMVPSYQIAVWLENAEGKFAKTLFLSEYLAVAGYGLDGVCPDWTRAADWEKAEQSEFDAVTHPTPPMGNQTLRVNCGQRKIVQGQYRFCMQVHIVEKFNILFRGTIMIGKVPAEAVAEVFFQPGKHPLASAILQDVRARYTPDETKNP